MFAGTSPKMPQALISNDYAGDSIVTTHKTHIAAIVLCHSHEDTFQQVITALRNQNRKLDGIIVINQGSNAAIASWLAQQVDLTVITQENRGSAGGFCRGITESIRRGYDWTWVFDDDAIPELNALEELVQCPYFHLDETAFVASRIVDRHGNTYMSPGGSSSQAWYGTVLEDKCVEAVDGAWPGLLVSTAAVYKAGLPVAEFFFYDEDREFITRLAKHGKGYCVLTSVVKHFQSSERFDPFGKDFIKAAYYTRNHIARQKLGSGPLPAKLLRVGRGVLVKLSQILKGELPCRVLPWAIKGVFFFHPKIRYLEPPHQGRSPTAEE